MSDAGFVAPSTRRLRRLGIEGKVHVGLARNVLQLRGADGGAIDLTPSRVVAMRAGWETINKHGPHYETRLWLAGERDPVVLLQSGPAVAGYGAAIRGFAAEMARAGAADRLHCGMPPSTGLLLAVPFGVLTLAAIAVAVVVLDDSPWWGRLVVPLAPAVVFAIGVLLTLRLWPRPARDLDDFCRHVVRDDAAR